MAWARVSNTPGYIVHKKSPFFSATSISSQTLAVYYSPCVYYLKKTEKNGTEEVGGLLLCLFFFSFL